MGVHLSSSSRRLIERAIRQKYAMVSVSPEGQFRYPTGRAPMKQLGYDSQIIQQLPRDVVSSYCGVGNPFSLGHLEKGERVLDIGCGTGVDSLVAAMKVGRRGMVAGIDMTREMLARARENLSRTRLSNVSLQLASAEALPFSDECFEVIISNGVFNLVPDKLIAPLTPSPSDPQSPCQGEKPKGLGLLQWPHSAQSFGTNSARLVWA